MGILGVTNLPMQLTLEEMYKTPTGNICSPEQCSQMLTDKQKASEEVKLAIAGASLFALALLCTLPNYLYSWGFCTRPEPTVPTPGPDVELGQTDPQPIHSAATKHALRPTSVASAPQESPLL